MSRRWARAMMPVPMNPTLVLRASVMGVVLPGRLGPVAIVSVRTLPDRGDPGGTGRDRTCPTSGPRSDEREPVERERRLGEGLDRDPDEQERVVVAGGPVRRQRPAAVTAVDQEPLAVAADGDRDRL